MVGLLGMLGAETPGDGWTRELALAAWWWIMKRSWEKHTIVLPAVQVNHSAQKHPPVKWPGLEASGGGTAGVTRKTRDPSSWKIQRGLVVTSFLF